MPDFRVEHSPKQPPRHIHLTMRWGMFISLPLLLMSVLVFSLQNWSIAKAATHIVGTCLGASPYSTIQSAVNAASSGDVINICPGTYAESVNLSLMTSIGNITLQKVPGTTGDVNIQPTVGAGIWITRSATFNGDITLNDLNVTSGDYTGIDFGEYYDDGMNYFRGEVSGNVTLSNINASNNGLSGANIVSYQDISVDGSTFNDNEERGLKVYALENIRITNTQANNNGTTYEPYNGDGIHIQTNEIMMACNVEAAAPLRSVLVESTTAQNNLGWGINVDSDYSTTITNTTVISNGMDGVFVEQNYSNCNYLLGTILLANSSAQNNGWGYSIGSLDAEYPEPGRRGGGFRLVSSGMVTVDNADAEGNYAHGFCIDAEEEGATITNAFAQGNAGDGFVYGRNCRDFGAKSLDATGEEISSTNTVEAADMGIKNVVISNSTAISNTHRGFAFHTNSASITLTQVTAQDNLNGVVFAGELINFTSLDDIHAAEPMPYGLDTYLENSLIRNNTENGVLYEQYLDPSIDAAVTTNSYVNSNIICENGVGLRVDQIDSFNDYSAYIGYPPSAENNVDARGNWWGAVSGPAATGNPSGTGNGIEFSVLNPPDSTIGVTYSPWINRALTTATPNPTVVSVPVNIAYRFDDGSFNYHLEQGVGDPNNGPIFTVTPSNGVINGTPSLFLANREIVVNATPQSGGWMGVQLQGPCGLVTPAMVQVNAPVIVIEKSPDAQGVPSGGTAVFTVTVSNVGTATLTDVKVTDVQAPNCSRATGVLGDIVAGGNTSYVCSLDNVTTNFVNSITAEGYTLYDGNPVGNAITATDTASVYVASFTLEKTAFVAGFHELREDKTFNPSECALSSNITVPVSTTVKYCYTITNTGDYTLSTHSLVDSHIPSAILTNLPYELAPGESVSTADLNVSVTQTLYVNTTNVATWTAKIAPPVNVIGVQAAPLVIDVVGTTQATVNISPDDLDQDGDGIPDNVEGSLDINGNGIPAYLDPFNPTGEQPSEQPQQQPGRLFMPALGNKD